MRVNTEFVVEGKSIDEIVNAATERWRELIGDPDATLPLDAEINVSSAAASSYSAKIFVRSKIEE